MKKYIFLVLILLLAAFLRLVAISNFPAGLNADEAALGYNAYSLLLTGRDEHSHLLPVNLESFGDFKPALYSYLLVPLIKTLGLTEFAVRLPSALFGIMAVFFVYVFCLLTTNNSQLSTISALVLAVSPWHLHFSRGAWEVNIATTLILIGVIFFLKWTKDHKFITFAYCLVPFVLSMYTYQSARVLAPAIGMGLAFLYRRYLLSYIRQTLWGLVLLSLFLIPLAISIFTSPAASRLSGVGLLADEGPLNFVRELRGQHSAASQVIGRLFHNRPVIYTLQFIKNYLTHFDGNFLFVNGDEIQRNRVPETGLLYFTDFVLLFLGFIYLFTHITQNPKLKTILLWLFIAPLASAMTFQVPHALRAQNMVIPLSLILAAGVVQLFYWIRKTNSKFLKIFCYLLLVICYSWEITRYLHEYYVHYPKAYPAAWEYGFKDLVKFVTANENRYEKILVTDKYDQPYILFLFYSRYNPRLFQGRHELTARDQYNFSTVKEFDKYIFTDTAWDKVRDIHGSLIAAAGDDIPPVGVNVIKTINFPNDQPAFKIISN